MSASPSSSSGALSSSAPLQTTTAAIATTTMMNDLLRNYSNAKNNNSTNNNNTTSSHSYHYSSPINVNDVKPHSHLNETKVKYNKYLIANTDYINGKDNYSIFCDCENNTFNNHEIVDGYINNCTTNSLNNNNNNNKENSPVNLPPSLHTALKHLYHEMSATREENEVLRRNQQEQSALLKRILERQASLEVELTQQTQKRQGENFINSDVAQSVQVLTEHMTQLKQRHERTNDKLRKVENELKRDKASREELIKESRAILAQATRDEEARRATHEAWIQRNEKWIKEMEAQMQSLQQIRCTEQFVKDKLEKQAVECKAQILQVEQKIVQELNHKTESWSAEQSRRVNEEVDRRCSAMSQSIEHISQECKAMLSRSEDATTESYERFAILTREQHKGESEMRAQIREVQHKMETYKQENDTRTKEENAKHKRTCVALRSSISDLRQRCECQWNEINKEMQHKIVSAINANEREREAIAHDKLIAINTLKNEYAKDKADLEQVKQTVVTLEHKVNNMVAEMSSHYKLQSDELKSKMKQKHRKSVQEEEHKEQMIETVVSTQNIVEITEKLDKFEQERKNVRNDIAQIHDQLANMKAWHEESVNALQSSYSQLSHEVSDHHAVIRRHVAKEVDDVITRMQSVSSKVSALEEQCTHMFKEVEIQHEFYDNITSHSQKCEEREIHERAVLHDMIHDIRCRLESELNEQHVMSIEAKREFVELESRLELVEEKIKNSNNRKSSIENVQLSCDDLKLLAGLAQRMNTERNNATSGTQDIEQEEKILVTNAKSRSKSKENTELQQEVESLSCVVHSNEERLHKIESILSLLEKTNMESNNGATTTTTDIKKQSIAAIGLAGDTIANDMISNQKICLKNKFNNLDDNTFLSALLKLQQTQELSANSFHVKLEEMHAQWQALIRRMAQSETHTQEVQRRQCECESKLNQTLHKCTLLSTQVERNESSLHESSHVVATLASEMTALLERLLETEEHMQGVNEHVHTELEKIQAMLDRVSNTYKESEHQQKAIITTTIHDQLEQVNTIVEQLQISLQQVQQKIESLEKVAVHTNDVNEKESTNKKSTSDNVVDSYDDKIYNSNNNSIKKNEIITQNVENVQVKLREVQTQIVALEQKYSDLSSLMIEYSSNNNNSNNNNDHNNNSNYSKNNSDEQWQTNYMNVFQLVQFKMNTLEKEQHAIVKQFQLLYQDHSALTTHLTEIEKEFESMTTKDVISNNLNSDKCNLNESCRKNENNKMENASIHENKINEIIEECHLLQEKIKEMEHVNCTWSEVEERLQEMEIALTMQLAHKANTEEVISKWQEVKTNLEQTLHTELDTLYKELVVRTKDKISVTELQQLLQAEVMNELESTNRSESNTPDSNISDTNASNKNTIEQGNNNINECNSDNSDIEMENVKETKSAHGDVYDVYDYEKRAKHEYGNHETNVVEVHIDADDDGDHEHTEKFYNRLRFSNKNKNNSKIDSDNNCINNNKNKSNDSQNILPHQEQNDVDDAWKTDWRHSAALAKQQRTKARHSHII